MGPSPENFFEKWCSICGQWLNGKPYQNHACPKKVLDGIDGAHSVSGEDPHPATMTRPIAERIEAGLKIMEQHDYHPPEQTEEITS